MAAAEPLGYSQGFTIIIIIIVIIIIGTVCLIKMRLSPNDRSVFEDHEVYFDKSTHTTIRLNECVNCRFFLPLILGEFGFSERSPPKLLVLEQIWDHTADAEFPALQLCLCNIFSYLELLRHYTSSKFFECV